MQKFSAPIILKAIPLALNQSLTDWDGRPLAYERILFRNYKISCKTLLHIKFFESDSDVKTADHKIPKKPEPIKTANHKTHKKPEPIKTADH